WAQPAGEVLTNASQIRNLTFAGASHSLPTKLRGVVVTEAGPPGNRAVVISDGTAGIYLLGATNIFAGVHRGDLLEVDGVTDPGEFAPIVRVNSFHKLGTAPIPAPQKVTFEQMI